MKIGVDSARHSKLSWTMMPRGLVFVNQDCVTVIRFIVGRLFETADKAIFEWTRSGTVFIKVYYKQVVSHQNKVLNS